MDRLTAGFAVLAAAVAAGGCNYKMAGTSRAGAAGAHAGGAGGGGAGGAAGIGGSGGGGTGGGTGGTGGSMQVLVLDGGGSDHVVTSTPDANCGAKSKAAMKVAPDILILLDRSSSMNDDVMNNMCRPDGGFGGTTSCGAESKWAKVTPAITEVVRATDVDVNWGLKFFPDNATNICGVGDAVAVAVGPGNGGAITTAIMGATSPNGGVMGYTGTPTRNAAASATTYLQTLTDTSRKFILLATDGLPTCPATGAGGTFGGGNAAAMTEDPAAPDAIAAAQTAGFQTFVVGIATSGNTADMTLSKMAVAGGLARQGMPSYYPVSNATDLAAAIRTLIGVAATCTFQIGPTPTTDGSTSLDRIDVFGDKAPIDRDTTHTNGYDYVDPTKQSIEVYGPLCDQIKSGAIGEVTVTFRCIPISG